MSEFRVNSITNQDGSAGPQVCGISTFNGKSGVQMPSGPTEFRRLDGGGRGRGIFDSGGTPSSTNVIDVIEIATTGDAIDFGDDIHSRQEGNAAFASATRGVMAGGLTPTILSSISYVTIASQGGANDFGNLKIAVARNVGLSNSVRGISGGGTETNAAPQTNVMEFVTIASTGDGSDFGDLTRAHAGQGACASPTRGLFAGGYDSVGNTNIIDFITIATLGDAQDFGDLTDDPNHLTGCSNSTRGLFGGGQNPSNVNTIVFVTIATLGNAQDFGDLAHGGNNGKIDYLGACASSTRGVFGGGQTPTKINTIQFVTISTTGNTTDFGDLTVARRFPMGFSDVHGGLAQ